MSEWTVQPMNITILGSVTKPNTDKKRHILSDLISRYNKYSQFQKIASLLYDPIRLCSFRGYPIGMPLPVDEETEFRIVMDKPSIMTWFRKLVRRKNYLPFRVFVSSVTRTAEVEICLIHLEDIAKDIELLRYYVGIIISDDIDTVRFLTVLYQELWTLTTGEKHHLDMYRELSDIQ